MDQFLLFGDSLTQQSFSQERGFALGAALTDAYVRRLDVVNRGFSGYNTTQALKVIERVIPDPDVAKLRFLTIWFGANDSRLADSPGTPQHVPLHEYAQNLKSIIEHPCVRAHSDVRIIVLTPPPIDEVLQFQHDQSRQPDLKSLRRTAAVTAEYARSCREVAEAANVLVLDVWSIMTQFAGGDPAKHELVGEQQHGINPRLAELLHDGLHSNPAGYKLVFDSLMKLIKEHFPEQDPTKLKYVLPAWDDTSAW